ncbi:DNA-directed DNA polymerase eta rad30 [Chytriomyces hyalinus]|nr:DNA-directed DNA polymerase eta rad30 [Chytriomyces hyalinus]
MKKRVIMHIDLDSFYAQVESVRLGLPNDVPLAVQQWQLLTAVNYAARAFGLKKMSSVDEARRLCPDITLVHVASMTAEDSAPQYHPNPHYSTHKISLDVYRNASKTIMTLLSRFSNSFQRASIDEAYLDLTDEVNARIERMKADGSIETDPDSGLPIVDWTGAGIVVGLSDVEKKPPAAPTVSEASTPSSIQSPPPMEESDMFEEEQNQAAQSPKLLPVAPEAIKPKLTTLGWADLQLRIGADICNDIRDTVFKELHYTCSAGISHNKTLAKIGSGLNKPFKQSILLEDQVLPFLEPLPFSKIRNLGGKLGTEIEEAWNIKTCGELWKIPLPALQTTLGEAQGIWVHDISRGICSESVTFAQLQKSLGAVKSLRPPVSKMADISKWLHVLASEIFLRLKEDHEDHARWPRTFSVIYRTNISRQSTARSGPMPSRVRLTTPDILAKLALSLIGSASIVPCGMLSLNCTSFAPEESTSTTSVTHFFKKVEQDGEKAVTPVQSDEHVSGRQEEKREIGAISNESLQSNNSENQTQHPCLRPLDAVLNSGIDKDHCIRCDICGQWIEPDDLSLAEHQDYHVALTLHQSLPTGEPTIIAPRSQASTSGRKGASSSSADKGKKRKKTENAAESSNPSISRFFKPV